MGKILTDSQGHIIVAGGNSFEVTASVDSNITAGNIKHGVSILGVEGTYAGETPSLQNKSVTPTTSQQSISADSGYDGLDTVTVEAIQTETKSATPSTSQQTITPSSGKFLTQVTVGAVTSAIDNNITAGNIKKDVQILGVTGTYEGSGGGASFTFYTMSRGV